jgi:hypothetical protein
METEHVYIYNVAYKLSSVSHSSLQYLLHAPRSREIHQPATYL